jgi:hypothetical protein
MRVEQSDCVQLERVTSEPARAGIVAQPERHLGVRRGHLARGPGPWPEQPGLQRRHDELLLTRIRAEVSAQPQVDVETGARNLPHADDRLLV